MNLYGITPGSHNEMKIILLKKQRVITNFLIIAILLILFISIFFGFGILKSKKYYGPEYGVAKLITSTSTGTCFRISESKLMTARHVIRDLSIGDEVAVVFDKFDPIIETSAKIIWIPKEVNNGLHTSYNDYAVLEFSENIDLNEIPELLLGISSDVEVKEEVYAIGYPEGNDENRITDGIVSATSFSYQGQEFDFLFDVNVDVDQGNSGGPLILKETEEVIGIVIMVKTGKHTKYNLALKIDEVKEQLNNSQVNLILEE